MHGKRNHKKSNKNSKVVLLLISVAVILCILFLLLIILPRIAPDFLPTSKVIINAICEGFGPISFFVTSIIGLIEIIVSHKKGWKKILVNLSKKLLCIVIIFVIPMSLPFAGKAVIQHYEEQRPPVSQNNNNENTLVTSVAEDNTFVFSISFDEVLFENYTIDELLDNCELLEKQIYEELISKKYDYSDNQNNFAKYEQCVLRAKPYEDMYLIMCQENLFKLVDREERYNCLDKGTGYREEGDMFYKDDENQRLIGHRHLEYAAEYCFDEDSEKELVHYKKSIKWFLTSINTAFCKSEDYKPTNLTTIDIIIDTYNEICKINSLDDQTSTRAQILRDVFLNIKESYFVK